MKQDLCNVGLLFNARINASISSELCAFMNNLMFTNLNLFYTYVQKVFHHPAKMVARSGKVPALDNLNNMIMVVHSILSLYLMLRKYSLFPQL